MDDSKRLYLGKRREEWVKDAAKAIVATTTPSGRFLMLREGFFAFEQRSRPAFKELAGFEFTSGELRWVWEALGRYVMRREKRLQPQFERMYEKSRRAGGKTAAAAIEDGTPSTPGPIEVDTANGTVIH